MHIKKKHGKTRKNTGCDGKFFKKMYIKQHISLPTGHGNTVAMNIYVYGRESRSVLCKTAVYSNGLSIRIYEADSLMLLELSVRLRG